MTALATSHSHTLKLAVAALDESTLRVKRMLAAFQSFKSTRKPDLDLIADAFSFARETQIEFKVIDLITIYRTVLEMRDEIHPRRVATCDRFLDEVEKSLNYFLDHKTLPERKMRVSQIIGPVVEPADIPGKENKEKRASGEIGSTQRT